MLSNIDLKHLKDIAESLVGNKQPRAMRTVAIDGNNVVIQAAGNGSSTAGAQMSWTTDGDTSIRVQIIVKGPDTVIKSMV